MKVSFEYRKGEPNNGWRERHNRAVLYPERKELALVKALDAWFEYAAQYRRQWGTPIGADYVLGVAWFQWGKALHDLLSGETGRLDCGTLSGFIINTATANGCEWEC